MYESFFDLDQRPFPATPLVARYFAAGTIETARKSLARCIERAEGTGLAVGPAGTGKTLLCYVLAEQFKTSFSVVLLFSGNLTTRRELLQAILFELGLPYRGMEEGELRLSLIDHLSRGEKCPAGMLLIVDEAHSLPLKLLEEVRMITNLVRQGQPRVRLVLAGNPVLEEHLASPKLAALSQRLAARCYLESFDRAETLDYVRAQLASVGGAADSIFQPAALDAIFQATDGIPRLVNQLCDQALLLALTQGRRVLDAAVVEAAWANLQQLPTPWSAGSLAAEGKTPATEVIEFGPLDESPHEALAQPESAIEDPTTLPVDNTPLLHLAHFEDLLEAMDDELSLVEIGLPEVDLLFDELEIETYPVLPESALPPLPLVSTTQTPDNQVSSEHAYSVLDEPDFENFVPQIAVPGQGDDPVFPEDAVEEIVVDRYAALDAQKGKGAWPTQANRAPAVKGQPVVQPRVAPQAKPLHAAEKTLTLAEALVREATAVEQAGMPSASSEALFTVMATQQNAADGLSPAWHSLDLFPPNVDDVAALPAPPAPPLPEVVRQPEPFVPSTCAMAENEPLQFRYKPEAQASELMPFLVDLPSLPSDPAPCIEPFADLPPAASAPFMAPTAPATFCEPELIIVEDDPAESAPPPAPQVEPVSKKAYRQLFARLRKG